METVQITSDHLTIIREKYNCQDLTDNHIMKAMVKWDEMMKKRTVLSMLSFPSFQSVLNFKIRKLSEKKPFVPDRSGGRGQNNFN